MVGFHGVKKLLTILIKIIRLHKRKAFLFRYLKACTRDDSGNSTNGWILLLAQYKYNTSHSVKLITHSLGLTLVIETEISNCLTED